MKILVVDDELGLRHTLTLILEGEGHEIRAAADGEQALAMLAEQEADLVLCDVRMPVLDGIGFLERYRRVSGRALVIVMSAYGDDDAALDAMKRGAYDFIQKPFRADQVILTLNKAIEREGLRHHVQTLEQRLAELEKTVERAMGHGDGPDAALLPDGTRDPDAGDPASADLSVKRRLAALERTLIERALVRTKGNRTRAARLLELSPRALLYKIKEYGLE